MPFSGMFMSQDGKVFCLAKLNVQFMEYNDQFNIIDYVDLDTVPPMFISISIHEAILAVHTVSPR